MSCVLIPGADYSPTSERANYYEYTYKYPLSGHGMVSKDGGLYYFFRPFQSDHSPELAYRLVYRWCDSAQLRFVVVPGFALPGYAQEAGLFHGDPKADCAHWERKRAGDKVKKDGVTWRVIKSLDGEAWERDLTEDIRKAMGE